MRAPLGYAAALAALALLVSGCGESSPVTARTTTTAAQISPPIALPAGTFTDTAGQSYDIRKQAAGLLTLVYFGYTNCPDVCPTTMADLGTALRSLPARTSRDVQVVFISSDPARDTPAVMKAWLANFDGGLARPFVGLTTSLPAVDGFAKKLGIPLEPPVRESDGTVEVTHGAETLVFSPKTEAAGYIWDPGTTPQQYAHDITAILAGSA